MSNVPELEEMDVDDFLDAFAGPANDLDSTFASYDEVTGKNKPPKVFGEEDR